LSWTGSALFFAVPPELKVGSVWMLYMVINIGLYLSLLANCMGIAVTIAYFVSFDLNSVNAV